MRLTLRLLGIAVAFAIASARLVTAQGPASHSLDTLADLRSAVHAHPDSVELLLALGRAITLSADQVESHFANRMEAREYLDRAVRLRSHDPRTWLEYGLLVRKQHYGVDALRALKHAEELADRLGGTLTGQQLGDLHEAMARLYKMYAEDTPFGARSGNNRLEMVRHFNLALTADPGRLSVMREILHSLADRKQWPAFVERAALIVRLRPDNAEAWLYLGMGYHETGYGALADSAFRRALALADPDLRAMLLDVSPLLLHKDSARLVALSAADRAIAGDAYWSKRDPLYLTPDNERLAEHFSRVAYADLAFSDPWSGTLGRQSDLGRIWIWYGRTASFGATRMPMYHYARLTEHSEFLLNQLRAEVPERYYPTHPRMVGGLAFQTARFRGADGKTELVIYGRLPVDSLRTVDSISTGLFTFTLDPWKAVSESRSMTSTTAATRPSSFAALLAPGRYLVSVEAMGNDRASVRRDTIDIPARGPGFDLSDLLLADRVTPRVATPRGRNDLAIEGSTSLTFQARNDVGVVWELYGLATDSANTARYHVQMEMRDARSGLLQALRTLTFQRNGTESTLSWDAERALGANEAALEFAAIALVDAHPGPYRLMITVTDRITGARASAERLFTIVP